MESSKFSTIELGEVNKHYSRKKSKWFRVIDVILFLYFVCIFAYIVFSIVFIRAQVIGISMQPLFNKDLPYSTNAEDYENSIYQDIAFANRFDKGTNGDIVLIEITEIDSLTKKEVSNIVIKRIIARGGQRVTLKEDSDGFYNYYISDDVSKLGEKLKEPYVSDKNKITRENKNYFNKFCECAPSYETEDGRYIVVPQGQVFVLGDNRAQSKDSHIFGPVKTEQILGKVSFYYAYNENFFSFVWKQLCGLF